MNEAKSIAVDPIYIFDHLNFNQKRELSAQNKIYAVEKIDSDHHYFFLVKKDEEYDEKQKHSFINKSEKSLELIHPSIINLSGFSIEKPYLYYKYIKKWHKIDGIKLTDENIQKIFLGIGSGLFYLLSRGYFYSNFSINSIVFDSNDCPKLFDYINFDGSKKNSEKELINQYVSIIKMIFNKKKKQNPEIRMNEELKSLLNRTQQKNNFPTLKEFIQFFYKKSYCMSDRSINGQSFKDYIENLNYEDKIIYEDDDNNETIKEEESSNLNFTSKFQSCEEICFNLYKKNSSDHSFTEKDAFYLNYLPEFYIKPIAKYFTSNHLFNYFCYDDFLLLFPDLKYTYQSNYEKDPIKIYLKLMQKYKLLQDKLKNAILCDNDRNKIEFDLNKIRNHAIYFLQKADKKNPNLNKVKIELAVQYINGTIFPCNLNEALRILKTISNPDNFVLHMKSKLANAIQSESIQRIIQSDDQNLNDVKDILKKAERGDILCLLFAGFAFYTGFNHFPVSHSMSIHYYTKAAEKSPYAMYILGFMYFRGIIFPQNFVKAQECFKNSALGGYLKGEIVDCFLRRHLCRSYLLNFDINDFFNHYLPSFNSMFPNDSFVFPHLNHYLEANLHNDYVYKVALKKDEVNKLYSDKNNENYSMYLDLEKSEKQYNIKMRHGYSTKVLLSQGNFREENLCDIAKSYFYGENNFPINYSKSIEYFKLAADKGDSEAQWRYALMCENSFCTQKNQEEVEHYLQESSRKNNLRGKLLYALFLRQNGDNNIFGRLISECCGCDDLDSYYYYAMHLEKYEVSTKYNYYKKAADKGHIDALIRLIYILKHESQTDLYNKYLNLSASILNESLLIKLIHYYDKKKLYDQSNILIEFGIKLNYKLFNAFYADHLLFNKGIDENIENGINKNFERAKKITLLAYNEKYPKEIWERYIFIYLQILIIENEQRKAAEFLINHAKELNPKYRNKYLLFYQKLDKNIAQEYFITINFCSEDYQKCHSSLIKLRENYKKNFVTVFSEINDEADKDNPYALIILGKMHKRGKFLIRDLKKAVKYFEFGAEKKCPEGYYYIGKEYFYGRILDQDFKKAKKYLLLALKNNGEPRAGYLLFKIPNIADDPDVDEVEALKIAATFGYKRALYKYGLYLINEKHPKIKRNSSEGSRLLILAAEQNYKKAVRYCKYHGIVYTQDIQNNFTVSTNEDDSLSHNSNVNNNFDVGENKDDKISKLTSAINDKVDSKLTSNKDNENSSKSTNMKKNEKNSEKSDEMEEDYYESDDSDDSSLSINNDENSDEISSIINAFWI